MKLSIKTIAAATVAAVGLTIGGIAVSQAAVKPDCKNLMYPLCARSVAEKQVVDNSLPGNKKLAPNSVDESRLSQAVKDKLNAADATGEDVKGGAKALYANETPKTIANIGGRFADRHTEVGTFTLKKGTWLVNLTAKFNRTTAAATGDPEVQPMLQIVGGGNYVTIGGNDISPALDADLFGSAVGLITVDEDTTFTVNAFGYAGDRSATGSGQITVLAGVVAAAA